MLLRAALPLLLLASCASQPKARLLPQAKYLQSHLVDIDKAAHEGDAQAQFERAEIYELGRGVKMDVFRAREFFAKAANQGHLQARLMLAFYQQEGLGGPEDRSAALDAYLQLESQGVAEADFALGNFFAYGPLRSPQMAEHWYWRGFKLGNEQCKAGVERLYRRIPDVNPVLVFSE